MKLKLALLILGLLLLPGAGALVSLEPLTFIGPSPGFQTESNDKLSVAWHPSNEYFATGFEGVKTSIPLFRVNPNGTYQQISTPTGIGANNWNTDAKAQVAFSPDGRYLAYTYANFPSGTLHQFEVYLFNAESETLTLIANSGTKVRITCGLAPTPFWYDNDTLFVEGCVTSTPWVTNFYSVTDSTISDAGLYSQSSQYATLELSPDRQYWAQARSGSPWFRILLINPDLTVSAVTGSTVGDTVVRVSFNYDSTYFAVRWQDPNDAEIAMFKMTSPTTFAQVSLPTPNGGGVDTGTMGVRFHPSEDVFSNWRHTSESTLSGYSLYRLNDSSVAFNANLSPGHTDAFQFEGPWAPIGNLIVAEKPTSDLIFVFEYVAANRRFELAGDPVSDPSRGLNFEWSPNAQYLANGGGLPFVVYQVETIVPPTVSLSSLYQSGRVNGTTHLTWSSTEATTCTASGSWSGSKATAGEEDAAIPAPAGSKTYTLTCTGPGGSAEDSVTINAINPVALFGPEGVAYGENRTGFAAALRISEGALDALYGILIIVVMGTIGYALARNVGGGIGAVTGLLISLGYQLIPIWFILLLLVAVAGLYTLASRRGDGFG